VWQVRACVDTNCTQLGGLSPEWRFTLAQDPDEAASGGGLVVCGKTMMTLPRHGMSARIAKSRIFLSLATSF